MATETLDELLHIRAQLDHPIYEDRLLREGELLTCGRSELRGERGAAAIEYALVVAMFVIIAINLLTPIGS